MCQPIGLGNFLLIVPQPGKGLEHLKKDRGSHINPIPSMVMVYFTYINHRNQPNVGIPGTPMTFVLIGKTTFLLVCPTVDGRDPVNQLRLVFNPVIYYLQGFYTSQLVQDFFHQQYFQGHVGFRECFSKLSTNQVSPSWTGFFRTSVPNVKLQHPYHPCMVYLPTFSMVNVGKYTIHGWYGAGLDAFG